LSSPGRCSAARSRAFHDVDRLFELI
jgi:hypothetical protein